MKLPFAGQQLALLLGKKRIGCRVTLYGQLGSLSVNIHFSILANSRTKVSGFLTKTPQDIRKRCFKLEKKSKKARKSKTFSTFVEDFFLPISLAFLLNITIGNQGSVLQVLERTRIYTHTNSSTDSGRTTEEYFKSKQSTK